ncbi:phenylalanine--tRNA ligase subunit alpha [Pyrococcus abyssi]|uniref:Phenylalanine--tRNA ligase alpha subunit n=1 Tax=Pyrococcus abyssi (strain GE5 / Orsay) TaxID=272844 RepID=SYFA_PYRAB|nr:phenylalanine--tRNA ligase subunit alpha [Pyrococcus abyssi]Q9UYX3.1 RecName: Full=Phenylalanine--tRNA ligase alpha subunit; AltName: Full=Phenylalanyl-tRNA synthetase alpha subunit; Short=PheRS [Pyrococcus abyssi GE5]CAB50289.1 pheS phenylalanyl-tRNA synthetase, subunit alpha [Pyrococcus abyssi GE5]CCE70827.1 TPA: phenylalanyl-tRNA synthetase subunit alpha [Pyrococcus abyssi GE5]
MTLGYNEKLVLLTIAKLEKASVEEIVKETRLDQVAVMRAILTLEKEGLIKLHERKEKIIVLTDIGKEYSKIGLPEIRALRVLREKKKAYLDELKDVLREDELKAIVGILRREGLANVRKDEKGLVLEITEKGEKLGERPIDIALKLLSEKGEVSVDEISRIIDVKDLKRRKIAREDERVERTVEITEKGKKLVSKGIELKREVTRLTPELIASGKWREVELKPFNIKAPVKRIYPGKKQPYRVFLDKIRRRLIEMGFIEMTVDSLIETQFWNFDALFQPQNHPAREWTDTYQLKYPEKGYLPDESLVSRVKEAHERGLAGSRGWGYVWSPERAMLLMPRAHATALSARQLAKGIEIPGKYFTIQRVFRPDVLDRTHLIEFNQIDGFVAGEDLTFRHLLGILKRFAIEIAGAKKVKFFPDYYPFTEPSVQLSAYHPELGWVEFGGAGVFREEMTEALGIKVPVIAWGIGIDRLAMFKLGIDDIRYLFSYDLRWLREAKLIW